MDKEVKGNNIVFIENSSVPSLKMGQWDNELLLKNSEKSVIVKERQGIVRNS
jgi:hypothetical protein